MMISGMIDSSVQEMSNYSALLQAIRLVKDNCTFTGRKNLQKHTLCVRKAGFHSCKWVRAIDQPYLGTTNRRAAWS